MQVKSRRETLSYISPERPLLLAKTGTIFSPDTFTSLWQKLP